ncbi:MAG: hypothetical protein ACTSRG_09180 [Candidatus Helarchaeota archaeon]
MNRKCFSIILISIVAFNGFLLPIQLIYASDYTKNQLVQNHKLFLIDSILNKERDIGNINNSESYSIPDDSIIIKYETPKMFAKPLFYYL